jgi:hypothetical protein
MPSTTASGSVASVASAADDKGGAHALERLYSTSLPVTSVPNTW